MQVKTLVILALIIPAVILAGLYVRELYLVDACIDSGGSFHYTTMTCDQTVSHPCIPFLSRHRGFSILVFLSVCLAMLTAWLGRTKSLGGRKRQNL
jgi:heme A synthase